jgi:hypothetical protein
MRVAGFASVVLVMALAACSGDTATVAVTSAAESAPTTTEAPTTVPPTTATPAPTTTKAPAAPSTTAPSIDLTTPVSVLMVDRAESTVRLIGPSGQIQAWRTSGVPLVAAPDGNDGAVVSETADGLSGPLVQLTVEGEERVIEWTTKREWSLFTTGVLNDRRVALVLEIPGEGDDSDGPILAIDIETGERREVGVGIAPEYGVNQVSAGGNVVLSSATADLSELISFDDAEGNPMERPSPTDRLEYGRGPYVGPAVISPDGTRIAVMEVPETPVDTGELGPDSLPLALEPEGDYGLVIYDAITAAEVDRVALPGSPGDFAYGDLDFDGRWVVLNTFTDDGQFQALFLLDTSISDSSWQPVDGATGHTRLASPPVSEGGGPSPL